VYALLTGRPPFEGASLAEKVTRIRQLKPEPPTKRQMGIPAPFESVVLKLLAKQPEDRYQSAAEMLKALEKIAKSKGVSV
jgi:serine/threonine protein kinase